MRRIASLHSQLTAWQNLRSRVRATRNLRRNIAPYSYDWLRARRIDNGALQRGQGGHHDERYHWGHEARTLGTRCLPHASVEPPFAVRPASSAQSQSETRRGMWSPACRRSDDPQRHDHKHEVDDPADDPTITRLARLKVVLAFSAGQRWLILPGRGAADPGFQLPKLPLSTGDFGAG